MKLELQNCGGEKVAKVSGRIDVADVPVLRNALVDSYDPDSQYVFDCTDLSYISDEGVQALIYMHKAMYAINSKNIIRGMHGQVRHKIETLGLGNVFPTE